MVGAGTAVTVTPAVEVVEGTLVMADAAVMGVAKTGDLVILAAAVTVGIVVCFGGAMFVHA
jgi:hypothetical protein